MMARENIIRCDICNEPGASAYKLSDESVTVRVDLCVKHAKPIVSLMEKGIEDKPPASSRTIKALDARVRGVPSL